MNKDILKGKWKKIKGQVKETWGEITDDEINQMEGDYDQLVGAIQEKYGYKKEEARDKVNIFVKKIKECN